MKSTKKLILPAAVAVAGFLGVSGGALLTSLSANAATDPAGATSSTTQAAADTQPARDPSVGGHVGSNGTKEVLLTGDTAEKVKAAALAAVPGGTIERVENDAEGATYEAHMKKSDGTPVTVKLDASFNVTGTEAGPGNH